MSPLFPPSPNVPSIEPLKASLRGSLRLLSQGQARAMAAKAGMLLRKDAFYHDIQQDMALPASDPRMVDAFFQNMGLVVAGALASREQALDQMMELYHAGYCDLVNQLEIGWAAALSDAETIKQQVGMEWTIAASDRDMAEQIAIFSANQVVLAVTTGRGAEIARLAEFLESRPLRLATLSAAVYGGTLTVA